MPPGDLLKPKEAGDKLFSSLKNDGLKRFFSLIDEQGDKVTENAELAKKMEQWDRDFQAAEAAHDDARISAILKEMRVAGISADQDLGEPLKKHALLGRSFLEPAGNDEHGNPMLRVNFHDLYTPDKKIGAGDMLPGNVLGIRVIKPDGTEMISVERRYDAKREGMAYFDRDGRYIPVHTGDIIIPMEVREIPDSGSHETMQEHTLLYQNPGVVPRARTFLAGGPDVSLQKGENPRKGNEAAPSAAKAKVTVSPKAPEQWQAPVHEQAHDLMAEQREAMSKVHLDQNFFLEVFGHSAVEAQRFIINRDPVKGGPLKFLGFQIASFNEAFWPYLLQIAKDCEKEGITYNPQTAESRTVSSFSWREVRESKNHALSNHCWADGLDFEPGTNKFKVPYEELNPERRIPMAVVEKFKKYGACWGGDYKSRKDCMHLEFTERNPFTSRYLLTDPDAKAAADKIYARPEMVEAQKRAAAFFQNRTSPAPQANPEAVASSATKPQALSFRGPRTALGDAVRGDRQSRTAENGSDIEKAAHDLEMREPGFLAKVEAIAQEIGCSQKDLLRIMWKESRLNPQAVNYQRNKGDSRDPYERSKKRATGLIQFMPKTARMFGTTTQTIYKMTALEQLDYVRKFYSSKRGKINNYADLYIATFYPAALGKTDDFILGSEISKGQARIIFEQNPGIAPAGQGYITLADFRRYAG